MLLLGNTIRDTNFCGAITTIYDGMALKTFNTIAKSHAKRFSVTEGFVF